MKRIGALTALWSLLRVGSAQSEVLKLTEENYATSTSGKTVFVKFFAPWCGHCRAMAADWERLAQDWKDHDVGLIAEVDCTEQPGLCEEFEVEGYPTLYYGDPTSPETYDGPRDYENMAEFARENLGSALCSVHNLDACNPEEKAAIVEFDTKTLDELNEALAEIERAADEKEKTFEEAVDKLQREYERLVEKYNNEVDKLREETHYQHMRAVASKKETERKQEF